MSTTWKPAATTTIIKRPRISLILLSSVCLVIALTIYLLVVISNSEGQDIWFFLTRAAVPLPYVYFIYLGATTRIAYNNGVVLKHDAFTTRHIPVHLIEEFDGNEGLRIKTTAGKYYSYAGMSNSVVAQLWPFFTPWEAAWDLNQWLQGLEEHERTKRPELNRTWLRPRPDLLKGALISIAICLAAALFAWEYSDTYRDLVNNSRLLEIIGE